MDVKHTAASHEIMLHSPETRDRIVKALKKALRYKKSKFDGFAVSGYSMSIIGSILAHEMGKEIAVIRKPTDNRNSMHEVEGKHGKRWVFLDDLIATGSTLDRVCGKISKIEGTVVGICMWLHYDTERAESEAQRRGTELWFCKHLRNEFEIEDQKKAA
jgi:orotate phosphoribosyltransferase